MKRPDSRIVAIVCIGIIAGGWWLSTSPLSPIGPKKERPVLRLLGRVAKLGLWIMVAAERPSEENKQMRVVHTRVDEEGHRTLSHGEGW